ncbi:DUF1194 domain-containing protein [Kaistia dalseonensis]|uniref:DUF1194 domain-containing protein n=1 Tax=Kaistia dalseonensis TaxID=410840 RepID=A0ABU0H5X5_9HYPH|nr:DUF1194 domain-containing protein [Kaistia dalseonensis]MCX5495119.1 DUF1194 domain-containing protein [Kaistia dalseonensis]MDQ0437701.1 hypothetical protein [Kaistia dalseonensis]
MTLVLALALARPAQADDIPVDLELVLAVDVSRSMDPDEQALQRQGYINALRHAEVINAIRSGPYGRIAVTYFEWSGPDAQEVIVPWMLIEDPESADAVASRIAPSSSFGRYGTSISSSLAYAATLFDHNGFAGQHLTIDVSGDGPNNMGGPVVVARDAVVARGITINGLPIVLRPSRFNGFDIADLDHYYQGCVVGGFGAFTIAVTATEQFEIAIRRKLVLEISQARPRLIPAAADAPTRSDIDCMVGENLRGRSMQR